VIGAKSFSFEQGGFACKSAWAPAWCAAPRALFYI